ncbi:FAD-binding protein [Nakamurella sp. YIM 132087]|uniref:FAD-binding protein n=2 Tax=Nakamurella alba TaxID=2665158 RepID=A0A7K1FEV1_9ACTN|nr:FAD-binding protein [Nakamurella alba]
MLDGDLLMPGDPDFAAMATPWNLAVPADAAAVAVVDGPADIAAAVRFAGVHALSVAVRLTGHGAVPGSAPTLLIHTGRLDELEVRPDGTARVGAGVRWNEVMAAASPLGLAAPAGSSPHVGVVGFLTGGGIGPFVRTLGLGSDHVLAFDVVTGDGEMRRASTVENPALFWALRGGKGVAGIVVAVELRLPRVSTFFGGAIHLDGSHAARVLHAWRDWTAGLPEQGTSSVALVRLPPMPGVPAELAGRLTVAVRFGWLGDPDEGRRVIAPMLDLAPVLLGGMDVLPYGALELIHADPVDPMPGHEASSVLRELTADDVETVLRSAGPEADCPQVLVEIRHLGGALARTPAHPDAFSHRDARYLVSLIGLGVPPLMQAVADHADGLIAALAPRSCGRLPNFAPSTAPAEVRRTYSPETLRRLATLAATYDPAGVLADAAPIRQACLDT